jgi:cell wall-associated NlpC family hydrolase
MMAWAQGGVSMSHGSQDQYNAFPKVPISQLQPGDLVFFGSSGPSNHHGALYIGGGTMIEAPHTGAFVRYGTIYRRDLVPMGSRPG